MPPSIVGLTPTRRISCCEDAGTDDDPDGHGQEREPGLERRVAEDPLHVQRREEEHPEQAADDDEHDRVRRRQGADAQDAQAHERRDRAALDETNATSSATATAVRADRVQRAPALDLRADDRVDEDDHAARHAHRASHVEAPATVSSRDSST
jgi:hypothetical protein